MFFVQAPEEFHALYDGLDAEEERKEFLALASATDDSIGQIVDALKSSGLYDNSVIIFQSDVRSCYFVYLVF